MIGLPEVLVFLVSLVVLAPASLVYLFPTIVAFRRHAAGARWIAGLNVVLGCTIVGWVGALVWACKAEEDGHWGGKAAERVRSSARDASE